VGLVNVAEHPVPVDARVLDGLGELHTVLSSDGPLVVQDRRLQIPGLGFVWLAEP
jgi:amylosucrase